MAGNVPADGVTGRPSAGSSISLRWRAWTLPQRESQALVSGFAGTTPWSRPAVENSALSAWPHRLSPLAGPLRIRSHECGKRHAGEHRHQLPQSAGSGLLGPCSRASGNSGHIARADARGMTCASSSAEATAGSGTRMMASAASGVPNRVYRRARPGRSGSSCSKSAVCHGLTPRARSRAPLAGVR
jgi:hypothetical protein